jgi:hypothetical protein
MPSLRVFPRSVWGLTSRSAAAPDRPSILPPARTSASKRPSRPTPGLMSARPWRGERTHPHRGKNRGEVSAPSRPHRPHRLGGAQAITGRVLSDEHLTAAACPQDVFSIEDGSPPNKTKPRRRSPRGTRYLERPLGLSGTRPSAARACEIFATRADQTGKSSISGSRRGRSSSSSSGPERRPRWGLSAGGWQRPAPTHRADRARHTQRSAAAPPVSRGAAARDPAGRQRRTFRIDRSELRDDRRGRGRASRTQAARQDLPR